RKPLRTSSRLARFAPGRASRFKGPRLVRRNYLSKSSLKGLSMQQCSLLSLATAVPPYVVEQSEAKIRGREAFGGNKALFDRLSGVFDNAGIAQRHIVAPQEWYMSSHGWHDRNAVYLEAAESLFVEAGSAAIEKAGLKPNQI